jgi:HEAT repeat protein
VRSLGESLTTDSDPAVRAQAALSLGNVARQLRASDSTLDKKQEKVIAEYLSRQYFMEVRDSVRRTIVGAASELNCPEAESLIESATGDSDPSVKEEALRARLERQHRSQLNKLG